jgi:4-amino-4-deoxy-L-arabinose transferase-like glycosyltransferase
VTASDSDHCSYRSDTALLLGIALTALVAQLLVSGRYGYFRDEFYYFACGEHLDWGFVDQPPFVALVAFLVRHLLGESLLAIRFLPAVCNALVILLTGLMARELGGGRFAQWFAALATLIAPVYLIICHIFSMNCFDHVFWVLAAYILIKILKEDRPRLWVLFGLVVGVGLMNKYSVGFLGLGLVAGLVVTPARKYLWSKWLWLGGVIAFLIFLPHILWEVRHAFPTREFIRNATLYKNLPLSPLAFMAESTLQILPFTLPLWLAGLSFCLFARAGRPFRVLGWIYVTVLGLLLATNAKPYYLAPAYYMLFAAGAVQFESLIRARRWNWLKPTYATALVAGGLILLPYSLPVLPVQTFIRYQDFVGFHPGSGERGAVGKLPQYYDDMFGWENQVATVARVYNSLSPEEKARTIIYCHNYGEAGAIDFFGKKYGLPKAASAHNNYWYWGPGNWDADMVILVGESREDAEKSFNEVEQAAVVVSEYARPFETNMPIFIARRPKYSLREIWPHAKSFS